MNCLRRCSALLLLVATCLAVAVAAAPSTDAGTVIEIDGHAAYADRLLVRLAPGLRADETLGKTLAAALAKASSGGVAARSAQGAPALERVRTFDKLPGLAVIELPPTDAVASARVLKGEPASSADTADAAAVALKARMAALEATGLFESVEPDYVVYASAVPTDAAFSDGRLWGLRNTGQSGGVTGADVGAVPAWDVTTGANSVIVGVIDTGIRYTHQDLVGNMWRNPGEVAGNGLDDDHNGYIDDVFGINALNGSGNPFDDNNHGTHVAGTIGATANGGGPHVGVAWNVKLMALKFLAANGSGATSGAIACIDYAISKGARILNNSWGGGGYSAALAAAIERARQANVLFVAAAGNEARDTDAVANYPSNYDFPNVISVAALDRRDALAGFSNYGRRTVDLGAPGVDIFSSVASADDAYASFSGTSMATPHVAGVAALVAARFPGISLAEMRQRLLGTTVPVAALAARSVSGGRVSANSAVRAAADGVLELSVRAAEAPLRAGTPTAVFVTVSDLAPVLGASVTARFGSEPSVTLRDNGAVPDSAGNDGIYSGTLLTPATGSSTVLSVQASAPGSQPAVGTFTFDIVSRPPNDDFATRLSIAPGVTRTTGSNRNASSESGEPRNPTVAGGRSVWWAWTAPATATATITTSGSNFDTTLAVYRGTALGGLTLLAANDDSGGLQSAVVIAAETGVTYAIQVDGYAGASGDIVINHPAAGSVPSVPVIVTEPSDVTVLVGSPFELQVAASGPSLTYQWLFNDQPIDGATTATYARPVSVVGDSGAYRVRVQNGFGSVLSRAAQVAVERVIVRPNNDDFAAASAIAGSGRATATTSEAGGETGEPNHAGVSAPLASIWYRWTAPSSGVLTVNTFGSNFDTTLAAYRGSAVDALTAQAVNDDSGGLQSRIDLTVLAGITYYIAVDGYSSARGNVTLDYAFVPEQGAVGNDAFASRAVLVGTTATGSNIGASGEPGEPNHGQVAVPLSSVWWEWTAPANGFVSFDTAGSDFDTVLAVYSGTTLDGLRLLGADDDSDGGASRVGLAVTAGRRYVIAVDGYAGGEGSIVLHAVMSHERPDLYARQGRTIIGRGVFTPGSQMLRTFTRRGAEEVITLMVRNVADAPRAFRLELAGNVASRGVRTRLLGPTGDVTALALRGFLRTPSVRPGAYVKYTLRVRTQRSTTPAGHRYSATITARDVAEASNLDRVRVRLDVR